MLSLSTAQKLRDHDCPWPCGEIGLEILELLVETSKKIRKEITILVDSSAPWGRYTLNSKHNVELYKRFI